MANRDANLDIVTLLGRTIPTQECKDDIYRASSCIWFIYLFQYIHIPGLKYNIYFLRRNPTHLTGVWQYP